MRFRINGSGSSLLALLLLLTLPPQSRADSAPQQIQARIASALADEVSRWQQQHPGQWRQHTIEVSLPSGATALSPCLRPLLLEGETGRFPVGRQHRRVSCTDPAWSLTVRAEVRLAARIPVTRSKIMAGTLVTRELLRWQERALSTADGDVMMSLDNILGQRARRGIRAGSPLKAHQLLPPLMVERGQQVVMVAGDDQFTATTLGVALEAGSRGEVIRVKNSRTGKIVSARITERGKVATFF
ncbi:flagellar basal body P-ring formation chaperone FlgA [Ferrimonas sediminicola]|uniref:flagellar basal body P-ring formation chaperone FlgA n=1 Tax=Ferrimonas sediminicola TaxID=2569538 RepID=UPI00145CB971|nr:flagellar basal body P-ring formation chaperone FlgA [Ferrimonas sediminicola]